MLSNLDVQSLPVVMHDLSSGMLHEQHAWLIIWYVTWATCMTYHLVCYTSNMHDLSSGMLHEQHAWLIIWYVIWATCMTYHLVCYTSNMHDLSSGMLHEQHAWLIIWYVTWATWPVPHVEQEMLNPQDHLSSPMVVVAFVLLDL